MKESSLPGYVTAPQILIPIMIPGLLLLLPYVVLLWSGTAGPLRAELFSSPIAVTTVLLFSSLAVGMLIEAASARIETGIYDKWNSQTYPDLFTVWSKYLELNLKTDATIVAQSYLRSILLRFKFEMALQVVCLCSLPAVWLYVDHPELGISPKAGWAIAAALLLIAIWMFCEGKESGVILHHSRLQVITALEQLNSSGGPSAGLSTPSSPNPGSPFVKAPNWLGNLHRGAWDLSILRQQGEWFEVSGVDAQGVPFTAWLHREAILGIWQISIPSPTLGGKSGQEPKEGGESDEGDSA